MIASAALGGGHAQTGAPPAPTAVSDQKTWPNPSLTVSSRLVIVPTLVRTGSGELVHSLSAQDFTLLDNGVSQQLSVDENRNLPLALVVVMQTGGAASEHFADYAKLPTMIGSLIAGRSAQVALITFDSQPEYEWDFTTNLDDLKDDLAHPEPGDRGAAIFQAVDHAIDMLLGQPPGARRVVLLLSQEHDDGSKIPLQSMVRRLGENDITLLSATFSPEKTWLKHQFTGPRSGEKPYVMTPDHPAILYTFNISTPLGMALRAMRTNAAAEIASLSGGEAVSFSDKSSLERQLVSLTSDLPNRYLLSFRPSGEAAGFHALQVRVNQHPEFGVSARTGYWAAPPVATR